MKNLFYLTSLLLLVGLFACSDLKEQLNDGIPAVDDTTVDPNQLLSGAYGNLRDLQTQDGFLALTDHPTDQMAGPTRGRDWDDAGIWRVLHTHSWTTAHQYVNAVWRTLNRNSFNSQQVLCAGATGQVAAEATYLKVFSDFLILDNWGVLPRRECGEDIVNPPSTILTRAQIADILIGELENVFNDLPENTAPSVASKNAARMLLAKLYLNRAVYAATDAEGGASAGPFSFDAGDMNKVIEHIDAIAGVSLDDNYFDNFIPNNGTESSELIFVSENTSGGASGNVRSRWFMTTHYNQNPGGWNGFVALTDLYNLFEEDDTRIGGKTLPYIEANGSGMTIGFQVGQQFDVDGNPLEDRVGNPLAFTPDFNLTETGTNLEVTGIRCVKYPPDFDTPGDASDNDYVFFRYADARLMKAEAILRGGTSGETALDIVNEIRTLRGASALSSLDEQTLLDERGRELYWEGWRRNDQIRFGTFLGTWQEKPNTSPPTRLVFPIPSEAISTNPNLRQNPGY